MQGVAHRGLTLTEKGMPVAVARNGQGGRNHGAAAERGALRQGVARLAYATQKPSFMQSTWLSTSDYRHTGVTIGATGLK
jgi:hypothetical protein